MAEPRDDDVTSPSGPSDDDVPPDPTDAARGVGHDLERLRHGMTEAGPDAALADLRSELTVEELRRRRTERDRRRHDSTTIEALAGSLGHHATVWTSVGTDVSGTVLGIGADHVCLDTGRHTTWIRSIDVTMVRARNDPSLPVVEGSGPRSRLVDVLDDLVAAEVTVTLVLRGGTRIHARPLATGRSLIVDDDNGRVTVEIDSVVSVSRQL